MGTTSKATLQVNAASPLAASRRRGSKIILRPPSTIIQVTWVHESLQESKLQSLDLLMADVKAAIKASEPDDVHGMAQQER